MFRLHSLSPRHPRTSGQIETVRSIARALCFPALASTLAPLVGCNGTASATSNEPDAAITDASPDSSPPAEAGLALDSGPDVAQPPPSDAGPDAADAAVLDAGEDAGFQEAVHGSLTIPNNSGPVLAKPTLVTITFTGDPERAWAETMGAYLVKSPWLGAVGPEYGVGLGTAANVELPQTAPDTIDDSTIQALIASLIVAGTAPSPAGGSVIPVPPGSPFDDGGAPSSSLDDGGLPDGALDDGGAPDGSFDEGGDAALPVAVLLPAVYMIYIPTTTVETIGGVDGAQLCVISGGGYHSQAQGSFNGKTFAYAVVSQCAGSQQSDLEQAVSHEFIEASTDPAPQTATAWGLLDPYNPWAQFGGEVGDLCSFVYPQWAEGGYTQLQRVYSNESANSGGDPCLPAVGTYYGTDDEPQYAVTLSAGESATFTLTGWSTGPLADWGLSAYPYTSGPGTWTPTYNLPATSLNNGEQAKLTVTVPPGTPSGSYATVSVTSARNEENYTSGLVEVYVQ